MTEIKPAVMQKHEVENRKEWLSVPLFEIFGLL